MEVSTTVLENEGSGLAQVRNCDLFLGYHPSLLNVGFGSGHRATRLSLLIRVEQKGWLVKQEPGHQDLASHPLCCLGSKSEMNTRVTSDSH